MRFVDHRWQGDCFIQQRILTCQICEKLFSLRRLSFPAQTRSSS
jgi:hypothetical protein